MEMRAVVTVKQDTDGTVFFQLGDEERLFPVPSYDFSRQERVMTSLTVYAEEVPLYGHTARVNWAEPLEQGPIMYTLDATYNDGLDVVEDWISSVEDGYLTVHYNTWWGETSLHHDLALVPGPGPMDLTLIHTANGDSKDVYSDGIVYFDINGQLPQTDTYKTLTLHWTDTKGRSASRSFEFKTRK